MGMVTLGESEASRFLPYPRFMLSYANRCTYWDCHPYSQPTLWLFLSLFCFNINLVNQFIIQLIIHKTFDRNQLGIKMTESESFLEMN